jgi:hypothetical protein
VSAPTSRAAWSALFRACTEVVRQSDDPAAARRALESSEIYVRARAEENIRQHEEILRSIQHGEPA